MGIVDGILFKDRNWQIYQNDNINKKYIDNLTFTIDTNYDNDENDTKPSHNNNNSVGIVENENKSYTTRNTHSTSNLTTTKSNKYLSTTTIINTIPTSAAENFHNTAPIISSSSSYISENNTIENEVSLTNESSVSLTSNIWEWMNTTVFTFKGFNVSYLYVVIASASVVLIFSLLLLTCVIVRRKYKNKRKRMKLIDVSNKSNLRHMLEETTTNSQDGFDDDNVNKNNHSYENMLMKNKNNNCLDFNDYPNYPDNKLSSPTSKRFQTLPIVKNPSATHSTGKSIDVFQSNYNRMSTPVFPTSSSPLKRPYSHNQDDEFVSDYDFYSQDMKLNKSMIKDEDPSLKNSTKSLKNKGKSSPVATDYMEFSDKTPILSEDNVKNNEINDQDNNNNNNNKNNNNSNNNNNKINNNNNNNTYNNKNKNYYNNGYNNNDNKYYNKNMEKDMINDKDVNNLYPENNNFENNNYRRNLFAERNYNTIPRFNNLPMYGKNSDKRKYMSVISPREGYQYNMNNPADYLYQQQSPSSQLNALTPVKNSLPNYMNFNNPPNTLNKMVSPTTRLGSAPPPSSNQYIDNENMVLPPISLLNDENLINESENYPVDLDYLAKYSYKPVVNDELDISINDRIHLLQTYSDGWAFGKNVTTGRLGVFPLNRLFSVKRVKSDKESEKTKVNDNVATESPVISNNKITYSPSNIHHKNASQETLTNGKNSSSNTEQNNVNSNTTANLNNMSNTNKVKPSKNRTLTIKNLSDEDLNEKNQSPILSNNNNHLDVNEFNKNKNNNSNKRDITNDKPYFNNLRDNDIKTKSKDNEKKEKEENDFDSVIRLKIDYDDIKINKSSSKQNNNTKKSLKIY